MIRQAILAGLLLSTACALDVADETQSSEDDLAAKAEEHWFYNGPMPQLEQTKVIVSLKGNTARLTGLVPVNAKAPDLPNVKTKIENGRTRIDAVYPIATARPGKTNSKPGLYSLHYAKPYFPNGMAWTPEEGNHFVTWGGFPFLEYNNGIAFHGPITSTDNLAPGALEVWILKRGTVSGGCNRMNGEHVIELAHALGFSMRQVYGANQMIAPKQATKVEVIADYDLYEGKLVDVDYPTDVGVVRAAKVVGAENVEMFGSWIATELPSGKDLPPSLKWEGGNPGEWYVFAEHALPNMVCSAPKKDLPAIKAYVQKRGSLPMNFCEKKACYLSALRASKTPACN